MRQNIWPGLYCSAVHANYIMFQMINDYKICFDFSGGGISETARAWNWSFDITDVYLLKLSNIYCHLLSSAGQKHISADNENYMSDWDKQSINLKLGAQISQMTTI